MPNENLKIGDTVVLKSGGPIMTIKEIRDAGKEAKCVWFVKEEIKEHSFPVESLKKANPKENKRITGMTIK